MILLTQNTNNTVVVTLSENQQTIGSIFLLQVTNDTTKEVFSTIVKDISPDPLSYNTFYIPVTASANPYSGSLNLPLAGFYSYKFFEGTGSTNPTSSLGLNLMEIGKVQLLPFSASTVTAFTSSNVPSKVFDPSQYGL
jgi:hypothetical protein